MLFHVTEGMTATPDNAVEDWGERNMGDPQILIRVDWDPELQALCQNVMDAVTDAVLEEWHMNRYKSPWIKFLLASGCCFGYG